MLENLTSQIRAGRELASGEVGTAVGALLDPAVLPQVKADFLTALARRGESVDEITAFALELRSRAIVPPIDERTRSSVIVDVCGTGGDRLGTINVSTTVAFVVAAAGVPVAKHGNRAVTSQSGSADVLEELGIRVDLAPEQAAASLGRHNFAFFFAPKYHPAFFHLREARQICAARGQRTIFNFLGPLLNPASPSAQLMGVGNPDMCKKLALVLQRLGVRRAMVVSGQTGKDNNGAWLDELSPLGENEIAEFYQERALSVQRWKPFCAAGPQVTIDELRGGDRRENAGWVRRILAGETKGLKRDAVLLNAGAALFLAGKSDSIASGWDIAAAVIDDGKALAKLEELRAANSVAS